MLSNFFCVVQVSTKEEPRMDRLPVSLSDGQVKYLASALQVVFDTSKTQVDDLDFFRPVFARFWAGYRDGMALLLQQNTELQDDEDATFGIVIDAVDAQMAWQMAGIPFRFLTRLSQSFDHYMVDELHQVYRELTTALRQLHVDVGSVTGMGLSRATWIRAVILSGLSPSQSN
jgi:hypothetical protein